MGLQPARAEILLTPSENIKFFRPIRREFFKPSQEIFSSFSQPGQKNFSHLQKILNGFGQSGESFSNPLKKYFLRGFEKLSPDWPKPFNIFWRCEKFFCPGWLKEENIS